MTLSKHLKTVRRQAAIWRKNILEIQQPQIQHQGKGRSVPGTCGYRESAGGRTDVLGDKKEKRRKGTGVPSCVGPHRPSKGGYTFTPSTVENYWGFFSRMDIT